VAQTQDTAGITVFQAVIQVRRDALSLHANRGSGWPGTYGSAVQAV